jgi:hypothetical protein
MKQPTKRSRASAANAGPTQMAVNSKGETPQYSKSAESATVTPFKSKRLSRHRLALIRISELIRLAHFYRRIGIRVDADLFLFALAAALACVKPGTKILQGRAIPQHGLDILALQDAAQSANLGHVTDEELWTKIEAVCRYHAQNGIGHLSAKWLGDQLQLTSAERAECGITSIDAIDEPRVERLVRKAAEKKARDQTYNRTARGRRPQAFRDAEAETRRRLCQEHGITERTLRRWERAGKIDVRLATSNHIDSISRASPTGHAAERVVNSTATDPFGTVSTSREVSVRAAEGTEFPECGSEMKRSKKKESRMSPGLSSARCRGLSVSRMWKKEAQMETFDPSETIAALIEAEALLTEHGETQKLALSIGLFRLQLEIEAESQPEDGSEVLRIGIGYLASRLQGAAVNDNRLPGIIRRLVA